MLSDGTNLNRLWFQYDNGNMIKYAMNQNATNQWEILSGSITTDSWYHIAVVCGNGGAALYLDGALQSTSNTTGVPSATMTHLHIGSGWDGSSTFDGLIDGIRIYNRILDSAEIDSLYHLTGNPPDGTVLIPAKDSSFQMGCTNGEGNEKPVHTVQFTYDFCMDTIEVTQKNYSDLMISTYSGYSDPSWNSTYGVGDSYPTYFVTWYDAVLYCNARSKRIGKDTIYSYTSISGIPGNGCELIGLTIDLNKNGYRLPTEAEWEYACRAGTTTDCYWGNGAIGDYAWCSINSGNKTHPVGTKLPNGYSLYDMNGNVWEMCNDWYALYSSDSQIDPTGPNTGSERVRRGGAWNNSAWSAYRNSAGPGYKYDSIGFRVVLPVK